MSYVLDRIFGAGPQPTSGRVHDSCPCGATFDAVGLAAGLNHRYWMDAHSICRQKRAHQKRVHPSTDNPLGDNDE